MKKKKTTNNSRQHSVKNRIMIPVIILMMISLLILGVSSIALNVSSTKSTLRQTMLQAVNLASQRITWELKAYTNIVEDLGCTARLTSKTTSTEDKIALIDERAASFKMQRGNLLDLNGISIYDGSDYSDRAYFKDAMQGNTSISEPLISKVTGELTIIIAAPLWADGAKGTSVEGVVYMVPTESFLNDIMASIQISPNSSSYIINKGATTIAHTNTDLVYAADNIIENAKTNPKLKALAQLEELMIKGETGFGNYSYDGVNKMLAYAPIEGTNGWSVGINAPTSDFMQQTILGIIIVIAIFFLSISIGAYITMKLAKSIGNPVKECANRLELLAKGDLQSDLPHIVSDDEIGILAKATQNITYGMRTIIEDVDYLLGNMAKGNFDVHTKANDQYVGDFGGIITSIRGINHSLSSTLQQIREAADQVSIGSENMSQGAQSLAEGSSDQASASQELAATVTEVTESIKKGAKDAVDASENAKSIGADARNSTQQMLEVTNAMARIREASKQISNIILSIEEIASETNLLSLNASIEAARAGDAGKGFAVVAGEIGKLASQSAQAANDTRELIETAIREVENGSHTVETASTTLNAVIEQIESIVNSMEHLASSSTHQAESVNQINEGIEEITSVISANSATAEESSATSEELSAQAVSLNDLVSRFELRKEI